MSPKKEMNSAYIFIVVILLSTIASGGTPLRFNSQKLSLLYAILYRDAHEPVAADTSAQTETITTYFSKTIRGTSCIVKVEKRHDCVSHIGLDLFKNGTPREYAFVTSFLERFFLEFFLEKTPVALEKANADHLTLSFNGTVLQKEGCPDALPLLPVIQAPVSYGIEMTCDASHRKWFTSTWKDAQGKTVTVTFPSRQDLLEGKDKWEIDSVLFSDLSRHVACDDSLPPIDAKRITPLLKNLYTLKGDHYFDALSPDMFFIKQNGKYVPVLDAGFPKQSIANVFLCPEIEGTGISLRFESADAHDRVRRDTVSIDCLKRYFNRNHEPFIGFEKESADSISGIIVYMNKTFNHLHLISFSFPLGFLNRSTPCIVPATLHANIPTDNVNFLSGKYPLKKRKKYSLVITNSGKLKHATP